MLQVTYINAIPYVESDYVILGDADLTYDFANIGDFYSKLKDGYEFVVGNRFKGTIEILNTVQNWQGTGKVFEYYRRIL